ncbi:hypothetical protein ACOMHN_011827 [Nucella lapillus]
MATEGKRGSGVREEDVVRAVGEALDVVNFLQDHAALTHGHSSKGISLLAVKNRLMLQYLQDLTLLLRRKVSGETIKDHPSLWRLIENRTFLEKTLAIEQKLQYEIKKLVKTHHFGDTGESDGLKFQPNINNFNMESGEEEEDEEEGKEDSEEEEDEEGKKKGKGVYRPPKVAPMPYTGDDTVQEKDKRQKRRALSNALLADLRTELLDEPEEIVDSADLHRIRADRQRKEREDYEEKYFVRTSVSKKEKTKSRQMATMSSLDRLVKFDNYFDDEASAEGPPTKKRKTSKGFKGKGKKKGKGKPRKRH